jgi:hypothetical protein
VALCDRCGEEIAVANDLDRPATLIGADIW